MISMYAEWTNSLIIPRKSDSCCHFALVYALVARKVRASDFNPDCSRFDSCLAHQVDDLDVRLKPL